MTRQEIVEELVRQMLRQVGPAPSAFLGDIGRSFCLPLARDIVASEVPYLLVNRKTAIMCLTCGAVSHNPHDVQQRYCGACHRFHDAPEIYRPHD
jgi:hypothetical protein